MKVKLGPGHPESLASMLNLANSYDAASRTADALKLREETFQHMKAKLGRDHPDTLKSMGNLAISYARTGRIQDAVKLLEETLQLEQAKLGPDHDATLRTMNNLADSYIATRQSTKALDLLHQTLALRERRTRAEPGNSIAQSFLAWTHGQLGEAEQTRQDYAAAITAYAHCVDMLDKLDKAGTLKHPFFRDCLNHNRKRLALCRKAEQAVRDLDFALKQPAAEVPALLDMRVRFLLKEQKPAAAVESAAKMKQLAGDKPDQLYNAACLYALCAGANGTSPEASRLAKECAHEALTLLKQAVAKGYGDAAHMKENQDLAALRQRADFQKLLADLEGKK
jgi:tetratricopeptide (TPR) repeat protein